MNFRQRIIYLLSKYENINFRQMDLDDFIMEAMPHL